MATYADLRSESSTSSSEYYLHDSPSDETKESTGEEHNFTIILKAY